MKQLPQLATSVAGELFPPLDFFNAYDGLKTVMPFEATTTVPYRL